MDALETEHDHPIPQNLGQEAGTLPTTCSAAIGSAEMSGSVTETGGTFPGEVPPLVMVDTPRDDSSHSELSDVQPNSPSVIHLEPGFSLVANSIVVVKCDFGSIKPQTYTYNFTIVNTTTELIELNYQPIMRPPPFQQEQQTPEPIIPLPGVIHSAESVSGLRIPIPRFGGGMSSKHGKVVKEEPVDFSITMNVSSDTEMDTLHDFGGDMTSDSLDSQRQCLNTSDRTSTTTLQDQVFNLMQEHQSISHESLSFRSALLASKNSSGSRDVGDETKEKVDEESESPCSANISSNLVKENSPKSCDLVGEKLEKVSDLQDNVFLAHQTQKNFKCQYCGKYFTTKAVLKRHTRIHTNERPYICKVCSKAFTDPSTMKKHERGHTGERPFKCKYPDCDRAFKQWYGLDSHVRSIHIGKREHLCEKCGVGFMTKSTLRFHEQTHQPKTDERRYRCEICEKAFRTSSSLSVHIRIHTGEKPHKCRYCPERFPTSGRRIVHERIHTGEKPFRCDQCGKAFRQQGPLMVHLNIHTGEKPYKCKLCEKSFAARSTLRNHQKMHSRLAEDDDPGTPFKALQGSTSEEI
ncbi:zinc finger protein 121-like isoform X6 [Lineus longissimus]|uniref:zinc finger protein 121-like isoform X6 n=1 Tax=Lineus longissimus TaxID=88925 RepID=UPI00315CB22F